MLLLLLLQLLDQLLEILLLLLVEVTLVGLPSLFDLARLIQSLLDDLVGQFGIGNLALQTALLSFELLDLRNEQVSELSPSM